MSDRIHIRRGVPGDVEARALADLLIDCVEGGASVSFLAPVTRGRAEVFWVGVIPGYALSPDGVPVDTTILYKELKA